MGRRFVQQLTDGESIEEVYLVTDKQLRANRNGNTYLQLARRFVHDFVRDYARFLPQVR